MARLRRAGGRWRVLVHEWVGTRDGKDGLLYGTAHHISNDPAFGGSHPDGRYSRTHTLPASCEFDEIVVGSWLHVEQMDTGFWWMNVGGVTLHVRADRDGKPTYVTVERAGGYDDEYPGCTYEYRC